MAVEKVYKCDLCGEFVPKANLSTVRVGDRGMRDEDYETVDVGPECSERPVRELLAHAADKLAASGLVR